MTPYQRPKRRSRRSNGYVLLDRAWAERLGVRRSGGLYRIGRRELADRLAALSGAKPQVGQPQTGIRDLAANETPRDDLVTLGDCSHVVGFYETAAFLAGSVRYFLAPGLRAGDAAIVVATASHRALFDHALEEAGIDLRAAQQSGRYLALDASETLSTFMVTCMPDAARFSATIEARLPSGIGKAQGANLWGDGRGTVGPGKCRRRNRTRAPLERSRHQASVLAVVRIPDKCLLYRRGRRAISTGLRATFGGDPDRGLRRRSASLAFLLPGGVAAAIQAVCLHVEGGVRAATADDIPGW